MDDSSSITRAHNAFGQGDRGLSASSFRGPADTGFRQHAMSKKYASETDLTAWQQVRHTRRDNIHERRAASVSLADLHTFRRIADNSRDYPMRLSLWESAHVADQLRRIAAFRRAYLGQPSLDANRGQPPHKVSMTKRWKARIVHSAVEPVMRRLQSFAVTFPTLFFAVWRFFGQIRAIVPIFVVVALFRVVLIDGVVVDDVLSISLGLLAVAFGLFLFIEGLNFSLMPLGEAIGQHMRRSRLLAVLAFVFILGLFLTLSEPAVNALRILGESVDVAESPYLSYLLEEWTEILLFSIGIGVGLAAALGLLRIRCRWSLKPLIYGLVLCALVLSIAVWLAFDELTEVVSLAWDAGAVTTGPVTVPVVIAFGIGAGGTTSGSTLEGFGIVTVASLIPIIMVLLLGMLLVSVVSTEAVREYAAGRSNITADVAASEESPLREFLISLRAIPPLVVLLFFTLKVLLKQPLPRAFVTLLRNRPLGNPPTLKYTVDVRCRHCNSAELEAQRNASSNRNDEQHDEASADLSGGAERSSLTVPRNESLQSNNSESPVSSASSRYSGDGEQTLTLLPGAGNTSNPSSRGHRDESDSDSESQSNACSSHSCSQTNELLRAGSQLCVPEDSNERPRNGSSEPNDIGRSTPSASSGRNGQDTQPIVLEPTVAPAITRHAALTMLLGSVFTFIGAFFFNLGITYGLGALGQEIGEILPALFVHIDDLPSSPLFSYSIGLVLLAAFAWVLGFVVTFAEPGLQVMGRKIEAISEGEFRQTYLIAAVAIGVACGMATGVVRLALNLPLLYFLLGLYTLALVLTIFSGEEVVNVAWDSAGVTTGPITVPFVLSLGIFIARSTEGQGGFGILALSSVCPIVSVLMFGIAVRIKTWWQKRGERASLPSLRNFNSRS